MPFHPSDEQMTGQMLRITEQGWVADYAGRKIYRAGDLVVARPRWFDPNDSKGGKSCRLGRAFVMWDIFLSS